MIKKLSTFHLLGILAILVLVFLIVEFTSNKGRSSSFRESLVEIDTLRVSKVIVTKGTSDPFEINRTGDGWEITLADDKQVRAVKSSVKNSLASLQSIKPTRLVANNEDKWAEYQVDTAGTRVQVYEEDEKTLDLIIGRFGVQGQRSFYTYVRLSEETEVYVAADFMSISFGAEPSSYRFKEILRLVKDSLEELSFSYPGDSSFALMKSEGNQWVIDGVPSDSASTQGFFNGVRFVSGTDFADDISELSLGQPVYSLMVRSRGNEDVRVEVFSHPIHKWILKSSHNPDSWFSDPEGKLIGKLFPGLNSLLGDAGSV